MKEQETVDTSWKSSNELLGNFFPSESCQILEQGAQKVVKLHPWRYLKLYQTMSERPDLNWSCLEVKLDQRSPQVLSSLKLCHGFINILFLSGLSCVSILKGVIGRANKDINLLERMPHLRYLR